MFEKYFTENLKENEELIDILHHHPVTFLLSLVKIIVLFIVPFFFISFILSSKIITLFFLGYIALVLIFAVYEWIIWYFDVYIIADTRIIQIEQKGVFHRTVSEVLLARIQDVTFDVGGIFPTLFNYGDVKIRTASQTEMRLHTIADPEEVKTLIVELEQISHREGLSAEDVVKALRSFQEKPDSAAQPKPITTPPSPSKRRKQV